MSNRAIRAVLAGLTLGAALVLTAGGPADAAIVEEDVIVTGAGPGGGPHVRLWSSQGEDTGIGFFAYATGFKGGVDVAMGDVDGDGSDEIITGAGPGGGPHVKVFDVDGQERGGFFPFAPGFSGGVHVGVADIDSDPDMEIVVGAGPGGGPHVKVFDWNANDTASEVHSFFPFDPGFRGGVQATGVWSDDGATQHIVAAAGPGGGPHVKVVTPNGGTTVSSFFAYATTFTGGVNVDVADLDADTAGIEEIITGAGAGGGPHVKAFNANGGAQGTSVLAYAPSFTGGVDVGGYFVNPTVVNGAIVTGAGAGGGPHVKGFNGFNSDTGLNFFAYATGFTGGVRVDGGIILVDDGT